MNNQRNTYWHLTGVLILLALIARPGVSPADLRPVAPPSDNSLTGRTFAFRQAYRLPAGAERSDILFAHQWFQDSHLGAWEAGCRLAARQVSNRDRVVDTFSNYRIALVKRMNRPYWYEIELANADGSRADFDLSCGLTENEDRDSNDDLALGVRLGDGVYWMSGPTSPIPVEPIQPGSPNEPDQPFYPGQPPEDRWRCFAEGSFDRYVKPITVSATCASRAEAESSALWRCREQGNALGNVDCHLISGQCFRLPVHGAAYPLDCGK